MARKYLYFIGLPVLLLSCASNKNAQKSAQKVQQVASAQATHQAATANKSENRPSVERHSGVEFYTVNIADISKNDNTISHSSIATARPAGYKVTKDFFPAVAQNFRQKFIILHYTAIDNEKSIRVLTQKSVSAHYLVNDLPDNEIYQLVDENKRAYHAGISSWRGSSNLNDTSIGIEIVNESTDLPGGGYRFMPFPEHQYRKVAALVKDLATRYNIPPTNIIGHSDVAPTRKQDPGPTFPWKRLYTEYNLGMWYDDATRNMYLMQMDAEDFAVQVASPQMVFKYQTMLRDFGYDIQPSGQLDSATQKTIAAFQYHFRPEKYSGVMDLETYAILQALLQKYPK